MESLQSRILPRLVLDTINCLWLAHDSVHNDLKSRTRQAITSLHNADMTDTDRAAFMLLDLAHHLRQIEAKLEAMDRPFTAKKIRSVLHRVQYLAAYQMSPSLH
jgi:hypothetical protein